MARLNEQSSPMSGKPDMKTEFNGFGVMAVLILFWVFWGQSGWYRVDCYLKVQKACDLIGDEYAKKAHP